MTRLVCFVVVLASGCAGEAFVSYQGAVVESAVSGHTFEAAPATGTPVVGALVQLCFSTCDSAKSVVTAADGSYAELEAEFGGFIGSDTQIEIRVTAPDARTTSYAFTYETTKDPTTGYAGDVPVFLNFSLAPL